MVAATQEKEFEKDIVDHYAKVDRSSSRRDLLMKLSIENEKESERSKAASYVSSDVPSSFDSRINVGSERVHTNLSSIAESTMASAEAGAKAVFNSPLTRNVGDGGA